MMFPGADFGADEPTPLPVCALVPARQARFVARVYGLLSLQLLVTFGAICLFIFEPNVKQFVQNTPGMLYAAIIASFVLVIALACCGRVAETFPLNMVLLSLFTLCEAYVLGVLSSFFDTSIVLQAVSLTCILTLALTAWGLTTQRDFSVLGYVLSILLVVFVFGGLIRLLFPSSHLMDTIWAALGCALFAAYVLYDTWRLKNLLTEEEYVTAALSLYLDIINLFANLLQLLSECRNDSR